LKAHFVAEHLRLAGFARNIRFPDSISYEKMLVFARVCGHLLDQDAVISFDEGRNERIETHDREASLKGTQYASD